MQQYSSLLAPGKIGKLLVKNRVVMAPMLVGYANNQGEVSDRLVDYYEARARGGVGTIIVEAACVHPSGMESYGQLRIDHTRYIPGLERLAGSVKANGTGIFVQLFHAGRQTSSEYTGEQPVAPSPVPCPVVKETPRALGLDEIKYMEEQFVKAAGIAARSGFDGVELHAAHGYLINQFLSPHSNLRRDEYGGVLDNRIRFLVNIIRKIKESQPGLLLSVRLNIDDFVPGGLHLEESLKIAQELEAEGADLLHCSSGTYESGLNSIEPASYREGWRAYLAGEVKKYISIPVVSGGMMCNPALANQIVHTGQADFIFLGRGLLAESEWVNKIQRGETSRIRPCLLCNHCIESNLKGREVRCTVNFWTGRERDLKNRPVAVNPNYKVVVAGSGPAGMQSAVSLAQAGIKVKLYEKSDRPGGLLNIAARPPFKHRIARFREYLLGELEHFRVPILLNQEFTRELLAVEKPDFLIMATGSVPKRPDIPGSYDEDFCLGFQDILEEKVKLTGKRVAIIGGGANGCETADFLIQFDNRITIVEQETILASAMEKKNRRDMMNRLDKAGVVKRTGSLLSSIEDSLLFIEKNGLVEPLEADRVVLATGYVPNNHLYLEFSRIHPQVFLIGDAFRIGGVREAVAQADTIALNIIRLCKGTAASF